jgi:hypothetical protein
VSARPRHLCRRPAFRLAPGLALAALVVLAGCGGGGSGGGGGLVKTSTGFAQVIIETDQGSIRFELLPQEAPQTVATLAPLILNGLYDGKTFFQHQDGAFVQFGSADAEASVLPKGVPPEISGEPLDRGMVAVGPGPATA